MGHRGGSAPASHGRVVRLARGWPDCLAGSRGCGRSPCSRGFLAQRLEYSAYAGPGSPHGSVLSSGVHRSLGRGWIGALGRELDAGKPGRASPPPEPPGHPWLWLGRGSRRGFHPATPRPSRPRPRSSSVIPSIEGPWWALMLFGPVVSMPATNTCALECFPGSPEPHLPWVGRRAGPFLGSM
jgi:hypothetical protein